MAITHVKIQNATTLEEKNIPISTLLSALEGAEGAQTGQRETIPLYPMIDRIELAHNSNIKLTFLVKFALRQINASTHAGNLNALTQRQYRNGGFLLREEKGFKFSYVLTATANRLVPSHIQWVGRRVLPNVYGDKRLCFGQNTPPSLGRDGTVLGAVGEAIALFMSATFNTDLGKICGVDNGARKQRIQTFIETNHPTETEVAQLVAGLSNRDVTQSLTYIALASALNISLTDLKRLV